MKFQARCFSSALVLTSVCALGQNLPQPVLTPDPPAPKVSVPIDSPLAPVPAGVQTPPSPAAAGTSVLSSSPAKGAAQVDASYVIGPEDSISVNVWKEAAFTGNMDVRPDGMITMPLLGDLRASGYTPMLLADDIAARLKKYVTDPLVTVTVVGVHSKRIYLAGEFGRPGPMPLTPDMTILQAIISAGGLGPYANPKRIYVLRKVNGKEQKIPFNYKIALKTGDLQGFTLQSGDTIVAQ